jgi:hypothetical protein
LFHLKSNEELEKCDIELLQSDEADKEPVKIVKDIEGLARKKEAD